MAAAAICLLIALSGQAALAKSDSVFLEELTWTEVRDDLHAGKTTIIVPVGGTEQSGPHMALGKHNLRARVLAGKIAAMLGNALVAPVIAYVPEGSITPPAGHMRFAGTISIPDDAFRGVLEGAARSFRQHGFVDIVLIGDHGGYQSQLKAVALHLNREWAATPARVHFIDAYYKAALVRPNAMPADAREGKAVGVTGDPRGSTAALGQLGVDLIVNRSVAAIRAAQGARR
jgi:creatinine amidohydrolase